MSLFNHIHKSLGSDSTVPMKYETQSLAMTPPESVGTILGKVSIVWAGLFAGIKLGDLVLMATLVYTVLQIGLTVYERIIKPIRVARVRAASCNSVTGRTGLEEN